MNDERMNDCASLNDPDLLRLLQQSDPAAFQELYTRYWSKLYFLAHKRLKSAMAAGEIVQNVFLMILRHGKTLKLDALPAYLAASARYAVYHYLAAEKRRAKNEEVAGSRQMGVAALEMLIDDKQLLEIIRQQ